MLINNSNISQNDTNETMSFKDYKIDYNNCLGSGAQGAVYAVIKRPPNERGCFSALCPHLYDYIFRIGEERKIGTDRCIKIAHIFDSPFKVPFNAITLFFDKKSNQVMRKRGLSQIKFFKTNSLFSQFKTRVNGKTFGQCSSDFKKEDKFELRKSFVDLLKRIAAPEISFSDMTAENLIYDEKSKRWEIIDGSVWESSTTEKSHLDNIDRFIFACPTHSCSRIDRITEKILEELGDIARKDQKYTKRLDKALIAKISAKSKN